MNIAVDLDGVIFEYDPTDWRGLKHFGKPVEGVITALMMLQKAGHKIIIYSTRTNPVVNPEYPKAQLLDFVQKELDRHAIPYDRIETEGKPYAHVYIDDRAFRFESWDQVLKEIGSGK